MPVHLNQDQFYQGAATFKGADGRVREATVYSYESASILYDVLMIEGSMYVRTNTGQLSNMISSWRPIHYRIVDHFNLEHAGQNPSFARPGTR